MGNKHTNNNIDLYFENIKNESSDEKGTLDLEIITEFSSKALLCTCKIILKNGYGSGFFCRIPLGDKKELVNVLFTCHHVLTQKILKSSEYIILQINKKEKKLFLKNRRIFSNPQLDYSCIEILDEDDIEDFYSIDDANLKKNFSSEYYKDKLVIIFAIMKNKRPGLSNGLIKSINKGQFIYTCNTYPGSSGGVIVNQNTNCIIGMHRGECVEANKKNKNKKINLNIGIFMRSITDDINSNNSNLEKYIENNKDNEEKEEINIENNNDIENKKSSNNNIGKFKIDEADKTYKICLGGFSGSGKTCFALRIKNDKFDDCTGTAGMSAWFQVKKKIINNLKIIFNIWDIPGWRKSPGMVKFYLKGSDGVILLFSIIERNSFLALDECYELIEKAISDFLIFLYY